MTGLPPNAQSFAARGVAYSTDQLAKRAADLPLLTREQRDVVIHLMVDCYLEGGMRAIAVAHTIANLAARQVHP